MRSNIGIRLLVVVLCLAIPLPLAASEPSVPTIGQQREAVLFWPQAQRDAQFRQMYKMFPSDRAGHGTRVHALPPGPPLALSGQDASAFLASYMDKQHYGFLIAGEFQRGGNKTGEPNHVLRPGVSVRGEGNTSPD